MNTNQGRLLTLFDVYSTLRHLSMSHQLEERPQGIPPWSYSLFEKIPKNRSCTQAMIPLSYCHCEEAQEHWACTHDGERNCS